MRRSSLATAALLVTLVLALVVASCGDDDDDDSAAQETATTETAAAEEGTYVGKVDGSKAYIALVSDGKTVAGYICDADEISTWIEEAPIEEGAAALTSRKGEELGDATFAGEKASGNVTIDDADHAFSADLASGDAGLYYGLKGEVGEPGSAESGLIVLADGSQRGARTTIRKVTGVMAEPMIMPSPMVAVVEGTAVVDAQQLQQVNSISVIAVDH